MHNVRFAVDKRIAEVRLVAPGQLAQSKEPPARQWAEFRFPAVYPASLLARVSGTAAPIKRARYGDHMDETATNATTPVRDRWILHFTHIDNLPAIAVDNSLLCDFHARKSRSITEVGDAEIKENRRSKPVLARTSGQPAGPGGRVGDYVPFYYAPRSPMMYRIACDGRDMRPNRYQGGDSPLIYLVTTVGAIIDADLPWAATDGNAAATVTRFANSLDALNQLIDWPLMKATMWKDTDADPDRQRRRMAEFLVHDHVPLSVFRQVATYSDAHACHARGALAGNPLADAVVVRPGWYYGYERGR